MTGRTNAIGGARFGHTVDFISEGTPYARYMVTDGQSVAKPSPYPTKSGLLFDGWKDSDGNTITFPYTPTSDIQLTAQFISTREGMVLTEANKLICTLSGVEFSKTNSGWAIAGYAFLGASTGPMLVALSAEAAAITVKYNGKSTGTGGSFVYHGITYYYPGGEYFQGSNLTSTNTDVTDLYKCTESTLEAAALTLVKRYLLEI